MIKTKNQKKKKKQERKKNNNNDLDNSNKEKIQKIFFQIYYSINNLNKIYIVFLINN